MLVVVKIQPTIRSTLMTLKIQMKGELFLAESWPSWCRGLGGLACRSVGQDQDLLNPNPGTCPTSARAR